jgi:alpha-L-arabinofuranosidase
MSMVRFRPIITLRSFRMQSFENSGGSVTIQTLSHEDTLATNTRQHPDDVVPHRQTMEWTGTFTAPPHSISLLTFGNE